MRKIQIRKIQLRVQRNLMKQGDEYWALERGNTIYNNTDLVLRLSYYNGQGEEIRFENIFPTIENALEYLEIVEEDEVAIFSYKSPRGEVLAQDRASRKWETLPFLVERNKKERTSSQKLSTRELQVARLMEEGYKINAISEIIGVSQKTVSTYLTRIYYKAKLESDKNLYVLIVRLKECFFLTPKTPENESN